MTARPELYSQQLHIRISHELMRKLKDKSRAKGLTTSEMVRRLVLNYLEGIGGSVELK